MGQWKLTTFHLLTAFLLFSSPCWGRNNFIQLAEDEVAIFGYGSLMDAESVGDSLGRPYLGPIIEADLEGWQRTWSVAMENAGEAFHQENTGIAPKEVAYLNIEKKSGKKMNGVIFIIKKEELALFDRREQPYSRIDVKEKYLKNAQVSGGELYVYVGRNERLVNPQMGFPHVGIRQSYLDKVKRAIAKRGPDFERKFWASTPEPPSHQLFADRLKPEADPFGYKRPRPSWWTERCGAFFNRILPILEH